MYDAINISKYAIWYSNTKGIPVSNLRLQKVLYFIQAEFVVSTGSACFDDVIEAWDLGPVVPTVYRKYKVFGASSIPVNRNEVAHVFLKKPDADRINETIDQCNKYSTSALVELTHHQDPWINAYASPFSNQITPSSLKSFFSEE